MANLTSFSRDRVIEAIHKGRGLAKPAARLLGCDPSVVRRWIKADPEVANAMEQALEDRNDEAEAVLIARAIEERNLDALKVYLKAKCKNRGYSEQVQTSSNAVIDLWLEEISGRSQVALPALANHSEQKQELIGGRVY